MEILFDTKCKQQVPAGISPHEIKCFFFFNPCVWLTREKQPAFCELPPLADVSPAFFKNFSKSRPPLLIGTIARRGTTGQGAWWSVNRVFTERQSRNIYAQLKMARLLVTSVGAVQVKLINQTSGHIHPKPTQRPVRNTPDYPIL